jgi:hypothetical protein
MLKENNYVVAKTILSEERTCIKRWIAFPSFGGERFSNPRGYFFVCPRSITKSYF